MFSGIAAIVRAFINMARGRSPYRGWKGWRLAASRALRWPFTYTGWRLRCRLGPRDHAAELPPITIILLSYSRPRNLAASIDAALACSFVKEVLLSNNNPDVDVTNFVRRKDPRLRIIQQTQHHSCIKRIDLARSLNLRHCIAIDDDLYLWPGQIRRLAQALVANPSAVHGMIGTSFNPLRPGASVYFRNHEGEVDVVSRVYAFTNAHARRFFELLDDLAISNPFAAKDPGMIEDIVLSFSGTARARLLALGNHVPHLSSMDDGVAIHQRANFRQARWRVFCKLSAWRNEGSHGFASGDQAGYV